MSETVLSRVGNVAGSICFTQICSSSTSHLSRNLVIYWANLGISKNLVDMSIVINQATDLGQLTCTMLTLRSMTVDDRRNDGR